MKLRNTEHAGEVGTLVLQDLPDSSMVFQFGDMSDAGNIAIDTMSDHDIIYFYGSKGEYTFKRYHKDIIDTRR